MILTEKQLANVDDTILHNHRWNFSGGAVRSGKTYVDLFKIPMRFRVIRGFSGIRLIVGNTQATVERNILTPLREIWGESLVGRVGSNNEIRMFGSKSFVMGADSLSQFKRFRGLSAAYIYGDEVATWSPEVFQLLKSRIDKPYSHFDGTYNPENPNHWLKKFLDTPGLDLYNMHWVIDDNTTLDKNFVENLKKEYSGTIYYDRYILGNWCAGEGTIYRTFVENKEQFIREVDKTKVDYIFIGVDFGGNGSQHAFVATGVSSDFEIVQVLASKILKSKDVTPDQLWQALEYFCNNVSQKYGEITQCRCDSAEQTLINGIRARATFPVKNSDKKTINDRIRLTQSLLNQHRLFFSNLNCDSIIEAMMTCVWDNDKTIDTRLDDGTSDIDSIDAFEYSFSHISKMLLGEN